MNDHASDSLAHASIPVPPGMVCLGRTRLEIYLRATDKGRYRWYHSDGSPTVIEGQTPRQAIEVARLVWHDLEVRETIHAL
ncbi:MAG: hypothetical protein Fur0037_17660 [Planctomycetota bacterium]